jgi:hypothetical protein
VTSKWVGLMLLIAAIAVRQLRAADARDKGFSAPGVLAADTPARGQVAAEDRLHTRLLIAWPSRRASARRHWECNTAGG